MIQQRPLTRDGSRAATGPATTGRCPWCSKAVSQLYDNLGRTGLPGELVSQFLPWLSASEVPGSGSGAGVGRALTPETVLRAAISRVLDAYAAVT